MHVTIPCCTVQYHTRTLHGCGYDNVMVHAIVKFIVGRRRLVVLCVTLVYLATQKSSYSLVVLRIVFCTLSNT